MGQRASLPATGANESPSSDSCKGPKPALKQQSSGRKGSRSLLWLRNGCWRGSRNKAGQGGKSVRISPAVSVGNADAWGAFLERCAEEGGLSAAACLEIFPKVDRLQQALSAVSGEPLLALDAAAGVIAERLRVDLVGVYAIASEAPECAVLVAARGTGASVLRGHPVVRGRGWAAPRAVDSRLGLLLFPDSTSGPGGQEDNPADVKALQRDVGLRSFVAVMAGAPDAPRGALLIASRGTDAFADTSALLAARAAATGVMQHLRPLAVSEAAELVCTLDAARGPAEAAAALLAAGSRPVWWGHSRGGFTGLRLAVLDRQRQTILLLEAAQSGDDGSSGWGCEEAPVLTLREVPLGATLLASAVAQRQPKIIRSSVCYLQNCLYPAADVFGSGPGVARSLAVIPLFTGAAGESEAVGGLYFSGNEAWDGGTAGSSGRSPDALQGFTDLVAPLLSSKLRGQAAALRALCSSSDGSSGGLSRGGSKATDSRGIGSDCTSSSSPLNLEPIGSSAESSSLGGSSDSEGDSNSSNSSTIIRANSKGSSRTVSSSSSNSSSRGSSRGPPIVTAGPGDRPCIQAMLRVLQTELQEWQQRCAQLDSRALDAFASDQCDGSCSSSGGGFASDSSTWPSGSRLRDNAAVALGALSSGAGFCSGRRGDGDGVLEVGERLGRGGFGAVFRGWWHGAPAAVKVMRDRGGGDGTGGAVASAIELAVLSSVAHPNIVSVYACLTNIVRLAADSATACMDEKLSTRPGPLRFRPACPADGPAAPTYTLAVLEYCDRGTLRDAVAAGAFHERLETDAIAVDLPAVVDILIAVARALTYLHRLSVLHGDLKMANILLRGDTTAPAGVTPKLADLGLAKILRGTDHVINHSGSGTVTHLAPEMFVHGTRVTAAVDVYAFGVLMWEVFTARHPYAGLSRAAIIHRVLHRGLRPVFPTGAPHAYAELAAACWAPDPAARPAMGDVARALQGVAAGLRAGGAAGGGEGGG